jgi:adenosylhomocysteinase
MNKIAAIDDFLQNRYQIEEYPALAAQFELWSAARPLAGKKILDGTPVFANTLLKYKNLLAAGAELVVGYCDNIPYDPEIIDFLNMDIG